MIRLVAGGILIVIGVVWILQGFDVAFAPESFMTGDQFWIGGGALAVIAGAGLMWWGYRSRVTSDQS